MIIYYLKYKKGKTQFWLLQVLNIITTPNIERKTLSNIIRELKSLSSIFYKNDSSKGSLKRNFLKFI